MALDYSIKYIMALINSPDRQEPPFVGIVILIIIVALSIFLYWCSIEQKKEKLVE